MSDVGFCLACGEQADGVEPDARRYECSCCGKRAVYGFAELVMNGKIEIVGGEDENDETSASGGVA